jgi:hypothetical protein
MAARSNLRQAVDDGAPANGKLASHADLETAMQVALNNGEDGPIPDLHSHADRRRGPGTERVPADVQHALQVTAFGAFPVARQAAARMLPKGCGAILFAGASASVKGLPAGEFQSCGAN